MDILIKIFITENRTTFQYGTNSRLFPNSPTQMNELKEYLELMYANFRAMRMYNSGILTLIQKLRDQGEEFDPAFEYIEGEDTDFLFHKGPLPGEPIFYGLEYELKTGTAKRGRSLHIADVCEVPNVFNHWRVTLEVV